MSGENSPRNGRRLPSFKAQRDLSLGGSSKQSSSSSAKKFVPNLNVRRKGASKPESEHLEAEAGHKKSNASNGSKKKSDSRPNRDKPVLIQTTSVFSEGGFASAKTSSRSGGASGSHSSERHTSSSSASLREADPQTLELEKERLRRLLRDDFIDEDDIKAGGTPPIQLPMINTGSMFKDEEEVKVKVEGTKKAELLKKPPAFSSISDFTEEEDKLFLVQLPDVLPGGKTLGALEEGKLGKITVRASGATRLVLENGDELDLEMGTQVGFLQNAASVSYEEEGNEELEDSPPKAGDMTLLGQVLHRLVVTPSWESLLKKAGNEDDS